MYPRRQEKPKPSTTQTRESVVQRLQRQHSHPDAPLYEHDHTYAPNFDDAYAEATYQRPQQWRFAKKPTHTPNPRFPSRPPNPEALAQLEARQAQVLQDRAAGIKPPLREVIPNRKEKLAALNRTRPPVQVPKFIPTTLRLEDKPFEFDLPTQRSLKRDAILEKIRKTPLDLTQDLKAAQTLQALHTQTQTRANQNLLQQALVHEHQSRRPDFDPQTNPLAALSEHYIQQANQNQPSRAAERESHTILAVRPAGATLVKAARATGFNTNQLTQAIQRFTDPIANTTVRRGALAALQNSPTLYLELQRALEANDVTLELQRQEFIANAQANQENLADQINAELSSGIPLEKNVRRLLELHFNTDLSRVRVHTNANANELSQKTHALAFTTGQHIFFRAGTYNPDSSAGFELLAHEVAHTIQQASGQVSAGIDSSPSLESAAQLEGRKAVAQKSVLEQKINTLDGFLAREKLEQKAPSLEAKTPVSRPQATKESQISSGFQMWSQYPLQRAPAATTEPNASDVTEKLCVAVDDAGVNLRQKPEPTGALVRNLPFKTRMAIVKEHAGGWYEVRTLDGQKKNHGFVAKHLVSVAPEAGAQLHKVQKGESVIGIAEKYYKSAVRPGEDLRFFVNVLAFINPKALPKPNNNQDESWKETKALQNYAIWIPSIEFAKTLRSKVGSGSITGGLWAQAKNAASYVIRSILENIPGGKDILNWLEKVGKNLGTILKNPGRFVSNLVKAVKQGFDRFTGNLVANLEDGMLAFLTGSMGGMGITMPQQFDVPGVVSLGLQSVGLTRATFEARLGKQIGPANVAKLSTLEDGVGTMWTSIQKDGLAGTITSQIEKPEVLKATVLSGIQGYLTNTLIKKALATIGSFFIPGGGLVSLAVRIFDMVSFIIDKAKSFAQVISSISDSMVNIIQGKTEAAASHIENTIKKFLPVGIGLLASLAGVGKIGNSIKEVLQRIRTQVSDAFDRLIKFIADKAKPLLARNGSSATNPSSSTTNTTTANQGSKVPKTLAQFKAFAMKFGVQAKRILSFTDDKTSDDTHDEKVARGLDAIETEETKYIKDKLITLEDAKKVASTVKQNHSVFKAIEAVENASKTNVQYNWVASGGSLLGANLRRPPYTDALEPAADEGTLANPFLINWGKPASAKYPTIYLGGKRNHLPVNQRFISQSDLKSKVGQKDDQNVEIKAHTPHNQETLSGGEKLGLSSSYYLAVGTIVGPLAPKGTTTPGGRKITDVLKRYGFNPSTEKMDGDHIHEIQVGGLDALENLWMLDSSTNQAAGGQLDRTELVLKNGKKPKLFQLREYVAKTNRKIYFQIKSTL